MARILVVDDNADVRLALATILEDAGHEIIEAEDGEQVFDLVIAENPELVLLDVMMPRVRLRRCLGRWCLRARSAMVRVGTWEARHQARWRWQADGQTVS